MCGNERAWLWCESKRELVTPHVRSKTMFYPCTRSSLHNRTATFPDLTPLFSGGKILVKFKQATYYFTKILPQVEKSRASCANGTLLTKCRRIFVIHPTALSLLRVNIVGCLILIYLFSELFFFF